MTTLHDGADGVRRVREGRAGGDPRLVHAAARPPTARRPLDDDAREALLATARQLAGEALRVLAVARRDATPRSRTPSAR